MSDSVLETVRFLKVDINNGRRRLYVPTRSPDIRPRIAVYIPRADNMTLRIAYKRQVNGHDVDCIVHIMSRQVPAGDRADVHNRAL